MRFPVAALMAALLLAGCGGGAVPDAPPVTSLTPLSSSPRAMHSLAFYNGAAYIAQANDGKNASQVLRASAALSASTTWTPVPLGRCSNAATGEQGLVKTPALRAVAGGLWLFQPWYGDTAPAEEHALCELDAGGSFTPRDAGLRACNDAYCTTLWMDDLKAVGNRLFTNPGAGTNVFVSDDRAASWRVLLGAFDEMICYHAAFQVVGDRLLVGGECPLDVAYLRAYQLSADGARLVSKEPLPLTVPELENRNIQFIEQVDANRVFVGTEGGLLRSTDGGKSFSFVIRQPLSGGAGYPYIGHLLAVPGKPGAIVVGGFDKGNSRPYLAWSADHGDHWTDLSPMLPGYATAQGGQVRALAADPQGRVMVLLNEEENAKGHLLQLTLGKP